MPTISIILPTYNGAKFIRQSIDSCLAQTFSDFELIVVNDCSTDDTKALVETYVQKDNRVRLINNPVNKKLPISLNTGFENAKGSYFTWTSDDNYYAPDALEKMMNIFAAQKETDLVYCDYFLVDDENNITGKRIFNDINLAFHKWIGAGACFLYKAHIHFELNGYNPAAFLIEDYDFFTRAFIKYKFYYLPDHTVYYYREHAGSLTSTQANYLNNVAKIFLEKNLAGLEQKITPKEQAFLHRKLAIYYAVTMNNTKQYYHYLKKIRNYAYSQVLITVGYVFLTKLKQLFQVTLTGILSVFKLMIRQKS